MLGVVLKVLVLPVITLVAVVLKEVVGCTVFPVVSLAMVLKEVASCTVLPIVSLAMVLEEVVSCASVPVVTVCAGMRHSGLILQ